MTSLRLHGAGDLRAHREPIPEPTPDEELVRVGAVGICGSDLHWFSEGGIGDAQLTQPLVLGHECAGTIVGGFRDGQPVAVDPAIPCGSCDTCRSGDVNLCPTVRFSGHGRTDGALREYVSWPSRLLHELPDTLSLLDGALLEPLGVAMHAVDLAHLRPGMTVAVVGCGPIGLLAVQLARIAGVGRVIAVEPRAHRREAAHRLGADTVLSAEDATNEALLEMTDGRGCDVAFEIAGSDAAVDICLRACRPGARVLLAGIPPDGTTTFVAATARRKGLTLILVRRMNGTYSRAIDLVRRDALDLRSLVSHQLTMADAAAGFALAVAREGLKIVICPEPTSG